MLLAGLGGCSGAGGIRYTFVDHLSAPLIGGRPSTKATASLGDSLVPTTFAPDVEYLAAPGRRGRLRGSEGNAEARAHIVARLRSAELAPLFGDSFEQPTYRESGEAGRLPLQHGTNVGAVLRTDDADAEWIVLVAHYDHLGDVGGVVHPGADDNPSAVALLLALADGLGRNRPRVKRHIVFLFPDAEEPPDVRTDRMGSSWFWHHSPLPADRLHLAIVLDLMGGRAAPEMHAAGLADAVFVLGAEASHPLARFVRTLPRGETVEPVLVSLPIIEAMPYQPGHRFARSDYHGLREHLGRPFVFLTTGRTETYHTERDTPDTLDYARLGRLTRWVAGLAMQAADTDDQLSWTDLVADPVADARTYLRMSVGLDWAPRFSWLLRRALATDRRTVERLLHRWEAGATPTVEDYRTVQLASLRLQGATWRPAAWWYALW